MATDEKQTLWRTGIAPRRKQITDTNRKETMDINKLYKSKYLKAADIDDDTIVTIAGVQVEEINNENKPVLYMEEFEAGLVLNMTNARAVAQVLGTSETTEWLGSKITLFPATVDFQGKPTEAIRVKLRAPKVAAMPQATRRQVLTAPQPVDESDIPF